MIEYRQGDFVLFHRSVAFALDSKPKNYFAMIAAPVIDVNSLGILLVQVHTQDETTSTLIYPAEVVGRIRGNEFLSIAELEKRYGRD